MMKGGSGIVPLWIMRNLRETQTALKKGFHVGPPGLMIHAIIQATLSCFYPTLLLMQGGVLLLVLVGGCQIFQSSNIQTTKVILLNVFVSEILFLFQWTGSIGALSALAAAAAHMMTQSILNMPVDADTDMKKSAGVDSIRVNYPRDVLQDTVGSRNFNILVVGNTAHSKSTLINTLLTAFSNSKVERAISGRKGSLIDTCIRGYTLPPPINYITLINGVSLDSIELSSDDWDEIMNGYYPSKIYETNGTRMETPYGPIHGIILAVPTVIEDAGVTEQLYQLMDISIKYGISPMIGLTKVDRYYPEILNMMKASDYSDYAIDMDSVIDVLEKPMQEWSETTGVYEAHMWPIITYSSLRHKSSTADLLARKLIFETIKQGADIASGNVTIKDHEPPLRKQYVVAPTEDALQITSPVMEAIEEPLHEELEVIEEEEEEEIPKPKEEVVQIVEPVLIPDVIADQEENIQTPVVEETVPQAMETAVEEEAPPPTIKESDDTQAEEQVPVSAGLGETVVQEQSESEADEARVGEVKAEVDELLKVDTTDVEPTTVVQEEDQVADALQPPTTPQTTQHRQLDSVMEPIPEERARESEAVKEVAVESSAIKQVETAQQEMSFIELARQRLKQQASATKLRDVRQIPRPGPVVEVGAI